MVSTSTSTFDTTSTSAAAATSSFQKTVSLHDWWLIKAEQEFQGKKIAVAGLTSPEKKPVRVFQSAAIAKRYGLLTLEIADGVTVFLRSYINRNLTLQNGFSSQVFRHFCFGFPPNWEECATKCLDSNCESLPETLVSQDECRPSFSARPVDDGVDNLKSDASKNLSPLSSCHVNALSSMEDRVAVPAEPSSHHVAVYPEKVDVLEGGKKSKMRSVGKSMAKMSVGLERISIKNDASGEYSVLTDHSEDNITESNCDQTRSVGTSGVVLAVTLKEFKSTKIKQKENEGTKDGFKSRSNSSRCSLPQEPQAMLRCNDDNTTQGPVLGGSNIVNQSVNSLVETSVLSSLQSGAAENITSPSMEETDVSGHSVKSKAKGLVSDEGKLKRNYGTTLGPSRTVDIGEAMLRTSRRLKELSGNLRSKEKKETLAVEKGGSSAKQARKKVIFDADIRKEKTCIRSSESLSLKRSRSGRLLLPPLDFWCNQIPVYDMNRNITGVQEELGANPSRGIESKTKKS